VVVVVVVVLMMAVPLVLLLVAVLLVAMVMAVAVAVLILMTASLMTTPGVVSITVLLKLPTHSSHRTTGTTRAVVGVHVSVVTSLRCPWAAAGRGAEEMPVVATRTQPQPLAVETELVVVLVAVTG
jgi:hypothetical protein